MGLSLFDQRSLTWYISTEDILVTASVEAAELLVAAEGVSSEGVAGGTGLVATSASSSSGLLVTASERVGGATSLVSTCGSTVSGLVSASSGATGGSTTAGRGHLALDEGKSLGTVLGDVLVVGVAVVAVAAEGIRGIAVRLDELGVVGSALEASGAGGEL